MILVIASLLLVGINILLLVNEDSKLKPLNYLTDWIQLKTGNLEQLLPVQGVVVPSDHFPIFLDHNAPFKEFLVKEGDAVEVGTPLFKYESDRLQEQVQLLDSEISRLEAQKKNIDEYLSELQGMKNGLPKVDIRDWGKLSDVEKAVLSMEAASIQERSFMIEQSIAEKELEKANVDEEIRQYEDQRTLIESGMEGLTILSSQAGIVDSINLGLDNPVIMIASEESVLEGHLTEKQVREVEEGMNVKVSAPWLDSELDGEISNVEERPIEKAALDRASLYRFVAGLDSEEFLIGDHVDAEIVTAQAENAIIAHENNIHKQGEAAHLWAINRNGGLEKRNVTLGLQVGKKYEIASGADLDEYYVHQAEAVKKPGPFITPFKWDKGIITIWKEASFRKILKYILVGVLQR